jgi:hypothetical protein
VRILAVLEQLHQRHGEHPGAEQRRQEHERHEEPVIALRKTPQQSKLLYGAMWACPWSIVGLCGKFKGS